MVKNAGQIAAGIGAIVFDAVGTLIDPQPPVADVYLGAARRQGVELDRERVRERFHRQFRNDEVDEAKGPLVTDEETERRRWRRIVATVLAEVPDPGRAFEELWAHFARPDAWRCYHDVAATLNALKERGVALRIASNFDARLRTVAAGLEPIRSLVDSLVISSEVGFRKPHPAFYAAARAGLGLLPEQILWVGDDPENDVRGPNRVGFRGLLLDRHGNRAEGLPHIPDLNALLALS
jgi:putative hydrolase of the HAD superfamily